MSASLRAAIARRLSLTEDEAFRPGMTLADLLAASPTAINSIDLLDAVAGALAEEDLDADPDIPAFTLDHTVEEVMAALEGANQPAAHHH